MRMWQAAPLWFIVLPNERPAGRRERGGDRVVRRILSRNLLVFAVGGWFRYRRRQHHQSFGDDWFRAHDSWQWCGPVDE